MEFKRGHALHLNLAALPRWKGIFSIPELCEVFKDGRLFGKIAEHILALECDNLELAPEGGPFDLEDSGKYPIEVKSLTKGGFDTSPSYMLGASRTYDPQGHLDRINSIGSKDGYYILADNRELPIVHFYPIAATDKLIFTNTRGNKTGKRTSNQADAFLEECGFYVP